MGRCVGVVLLCLGFIFMAGCGSSSSTTAQLRIVMASPDTSPVDIVIDGNQVATSLADTNSTGYLSVKAGSRHIQALTVSNSTSVFDQTISLTASANQTLLLTGSAAKIQPLLLTDGATNTTIATGHGKVRVVNASQTIGPADVYIMNSGTGLNGATPVSLSLAYGKATEYDLATIGNYQVFMTQPGITNVFLSTGPLALAQGQYQTVVAVDAPGGGFSFTVLTDQ